MDSFRFIVVGIGVSAMLASLNTWMLLRVELETALFASAWAAGTLNYEARCERPIEQMIGRVRRAAVPDARECFLRGLRPIPGYGFGVA